MNKQLVYRASKITPKSLRKIIKIFYNPVIPESSKFDYGGIITYKSDTNFILSALRFVLLQKIKGDIIEFGTYRCATTVLFAKCLKELKIKDKTIYGLDTFKGLPPPSKEDMPLKDEEHFTNNDIDKVREFLIKNNVEDVIKLRKGLFKNTIPSLKNKRFCFAFVDCDLYKGTKQSLKFLIPRMNRHGIIAIDDFGNENYVGVKKAVLELIDKKDLIRYGDKIYWIK